MDQALYEEHAALEQDHWWFVGRRAVIDAVLRTHLPPAPTRRILDVGCGTGGMLPLLAQLGTVQGLEGEPMAVDLCRGRYGQFAVALGEVPDAVPNDGSFDLVTAFDVIEHIADDDAAVAALGAAARPGGHVLVTVPALQWLWSAHDERNGHQRRYDRPGLVDVLSRNGLDVLHVSYFNTLLLPVVAAARLSERLRPRPAAATSDFTMPAPLVNRVLTRTFGSERRWVAAHRAPVGVSLIALSRRPGDAGPDCNPGPPLD